MAEFQIACYQNEFLPAGATRMHAVITVTAEGTSVGGPASRGNRGPEDRVEVIMLDTSGSMDGAKLQEAKAATAAAIDSLPDGVRFAVVTGNHQAVVAYPPSPSLAVATAPARHLAKEALRRIEARGGTAMSTWISLTTHLVRDEPGTRHAILLTDGKNESEERAQDLDKALAKAAGVFQCDCRGVGADWIVAELRKVATALLGTYDIVPDPAGLSADFASMMHEALKKQIGAVTLQVRTPQGGRVEVLKQLEPDIDLLAARIEVDPLVGDYPTGAWGDESRDYHLCVRVPPGAVDDVPMRAAQVSLLVDGERVCQVAVRSAWTDDVPLSTHINERVAEVLGASEMAEAIQEAIDAWRVRDDEVFTDRIGKAMTMARERGDEDVVDRLEKLAYVDPVTGLVRPKAHVDPKDVLEAETRSTRTARTGREEVAPRKERSPSSNTAPPDQDRDP